MPMKAVLLYGPRDFRMEDWPIPEPGPGEVLVRLKRVGICGSDVHNYLEGEIGGVKVTEPLVLGHESAGVIEALGPGVEGPAVGTPVAIDPSMSCGHCELCREGYENLCRANRFHGVAPVHGTFREYLTHPAHLVHPLPEGMSLDEGALLEPMGISMEVAALADVRVGDQVAVLGCGPIGLLSIQMLRLAGAGEITGTDLVVGRLGAARRAGADMAWNAGTEDVVAKIMDHTRGRGVDIVVEAAGSPETMEQAVEVVRPGGTIVMVGIPVVDQCLFKHSLARRKGVIFKFDRRMRHTYLRSMLLWQNGRVDLKPLATHHFPLDKLGEAFDLVVAKGDGVLKAMIEI